MPLKCNQFGTHTIGDLIGYSWVPEYGQIHVKKLMAWFIFFSIFGLFFLDDVTLDLPILFSIFILLAIFPFALWTWLSLRVHIVMELLSLFEVWFMIFNFMAYSICSNLLLQYETLRGLHVLLDMIYFVLLVPFFALLDALPNTSLRKFKIIYGFNSFFLLLQ